MSGLGAQLMLNNQAEHGTPGLLRLQAASGGSLVKRGLPTLQGYGIWQPRPCSRFAPLHNSSSLHLPLLASYTCRHVCPHLQTLLLACVCRDVQHCQGILRLLQPPAELTRRTILPIKH